jgi:hypothetical protein
MLSGNRVVAVASRGHGTVHATYIEIMREFTGYQPK